MIRWCSYCQQYLGESPPYESFAITHGVCATCLNVHGESLNVPARAIQLGEFYSDVVTSMVQGKQLPMAEVLERSRDLHIRPIDLLIGMLQPTLYQIGEAWAGGTLSVAGEHASTAFVSALLEVLRYTDPARQLSNSETPTVLLVNAEGNHHSLGSNMIETLLTMHGYSSRLVFPGIPSAEIIQLAETLQPTVLGISVSMEEQMPGLREIDRWASGRSAPIVVAGGFYVRKTPSLSLPNIQRVPSGDDLLTLLGTLGRNHN